jgi:hypothetical protein
MVVVRARYPQQAPIFFRKFLFPSLLHTIRDPCPTLGDTFNPCIPAFGVQKKKNQTMIRKATLASLRDALSLLSNV